MKPTIPLFLQNKCFFTDYPREILECSFEAEKHNIKIKKRSDQLEFRPAIIKLIHAFAKHQEYSLATLHLSIYILDVYMDSYILSDFSEHQKLVGLICLLLSAKSEDIDEKVPSIKDLLKIVDMSLDLGRLETDEKRNTAAYKTFARMYCKVEFLIFESLEFNTIRPTTVSYTPDDGSSDES